MAASTRDDDDEILSFPLLLRLCLMKRFFWASFLNRNEPSCCHSIIRAASGSIKPSDLPVPVGENNTASPPLDIIVYDFCCIGKSLGIFVLSSDSVVTYVLLADDDDVVVNFMSASINGSGNWSNDGSSEILFWFCCCINNL